MTSTKLKIAAGVLGLGGLLMATPHVERSSTILKYDNHCLRVLELGPEDTITAYLGRGTLASFYFDVGDGTDQSASRFNVETYIGAPPRPENVYEKSMMSAKKYCSNTVNKDGLIEFLVTEEKDINENCDYDLYGPGTFVRYLSPDDYASDMFISCKSDGDTPSCGMTVLALGYWRMSIRIDQDKLDDWEKVYAAGKKAISTRLEPLDSCPIEIPFL